MTERLPRPTDCVTWTRPGHTARASRGETAYGRGEGGGLGRREGERGRERGRGKEMGGRGRWQEETGEWVGLKKGSSVSRVREVKGGADELEQTGG